MADQTRVERRPCGDDRRRGALSRTRPQDEAKAAAQGARRSSGARRRWQGACCAGGQVWRRRGTGRPARSCATAAVGGQKAVRRSCRGRGSAILPHPLRLPAGPRRPAPCLRASRLTRSTFAAQHPTDQRLALTVADLALAFAAPPAQLVASAAARQPTPALLGVGAWLVMAAIFVPTIASSACRWRRPRRSTWAGSSTARPPWTRRSAMSRAGDGSW
jgi:hypothetical protein